MPESTLLSQMSTSPLADLDESTAAMAEHKVATEYLSLETVSKLCTYHFC